MDSRQFRFGVSEFTTWPWSFEQDVERYAQLGVDCIEVCEFKLDKERAAEQIAQIADHGLEISSVQPQLHSLFPDRPRPFPSDPAERMDRFRRSIDLFGAAAPGVTLITITGAAPNGNYRDAFSIAATEYRNLADYAAERNVRIALEPLNPILMNIDTFICTIADALRIVEAVNRPNFGVWIDVWHVWQDSEAERRIGECGDSIFGVHINDWHEPRCVADRAGVGQGCIDLAGLVGAIRRAGYRGAYTLEIFSDESLPDSLWRSELSMVIKESRAAFAAAWDRSLAL